MGRGHKRATDEQIAEAYRSTGSVWKAAKQLGLAGQTVHERLRRMGHELAHAKWTAEEDDELAALYADPHLTVADVARRLNRTSAAIACRANELGLSKQRAPKHKRIPRGSGYDKASIKKRIKALEEYDGSLTKFCRANGLQVESFAVAAQRHFPEWWQNYVRSRTDLEQISCSYCGEQFFPNSKRQEFCSRKCSADSRRDRDYFGGKRRSGQGVLERVCQICLKDIKGKLHVHHVYGKSNDPDNEFLVALCSRCHMALEQISVNQELADSPASWMRMIDFVWRKRHDKSRSRKLRVLVTWQEPDE